MSRRWIAAALILIGPACGGDDPVDRTGRSRPAVEVVAPAVEALETLLGGPQDYFEINADHRLVNLFVASDDGTTATAYLFLDGEIQPPAPPRPVEAGTTFSADEIEFDPDTVLARVADELPGSDLTTFVIVVGPTGAIRYEVLARSAQGGVLAVEVTSDGIVVGVETI